MDCLTRLVIWPLSAAILYSGLRYLRELIGVGFHQHKAVFITGCDSGFGRILALKCARAGLQVFASCLTQQGASSLEKIAEELPLKAVLMDVTSDEDVKKAKEFVIANMSYGRKLWAVVNNAGIFSCYGPTSWCTPEEYKLSFDVNMLGTIRCTRAFLPLIKESRGRIISASSICGIMGTPGGSPYCVTKYGIEAYMDILRREMKPFGVKCSILEPAGFKATGLLDKKAMDDRVEKVWNKLSDEDKEEYGEEYRQEFLRLWHKSMDEHGSDQIEHVVDNYFHAITGKYPRSRYLCGWEAILIWGPLSIMPAFVQDALFALLETKENALLPAALQHTKDH